MSFFRKAASAAVFLFAGAAFLPLPGTAADPAELLEGLRKTYDSTSNLKARFVQTSYMVASGMERESHGRVLFQKTGKMRWDYEGDDPQEIVSDGLTLWIHQVRDRTVLKQELATLPPSSRLALDLLSGFEGVESAFQIGTCGDRCVELTPREARPDLARVLVELQEDGENVRHVTTEDHLGNRTRVAFFEIQRNIHVPDAAFAFVVPKGVQVLDMQAGAP